MKVTITLHVKTLTCTPGGLTHPTVIGAARVPETLGIDKRIPALQSLHCAIRGFSGIVAKLRCFRDSWQHWTPARLF